MGSSLLGLFYVLLPGSVILETPDVYVVVGLGVISGAIATVLPWDRFGQRSTLLLLPPAFALLGAGMYMGAVLPFAFGIFFIIAFAWLGLAHPRWTSLWFVAPASAAYVIPLLLRDNLLSIDATSAVVTIPACVLVAEVIAWVGQRERRSRDRAEALSRTFTALSAGVDGEDVLESLVEEARRATQSRHSVLFQLDTTRMTLDGIYTAGVGEPYRTMYHDLVGGSYADFPPVKELVGRTEPTVIENTLKTHGFPPGVIDPFLVKSFIAVPITVDGRGVGILTCGESRKRRRYTEDDIALLGLLAKQAGNTMRDALLHRRSLESARRDDLTALENRRAFKDRVSVEIDRAREKADQFTVILFDVDAFRSINETWGHDAGDRALQRVASFLDGSFGNDCGAYRVGGDEFALVCPGLDLTAATLKAEASRHHIERARLGAGRDPRLTVSIGVSNFPLHAITVDELFERAATAVIDVKAAGGNAVSAAFARNEWGPGSKLGVDLNSIIERGVIAHFQPIVDLSGGGLLGYEAFSRMDPKMGITPTTTLFRAAASLGLTEQLDKLCLNTVLREARKMPNDVLLFVNLSPATLQSPQFEPSSLVDMITGHGIDLDRVVLEITEHERANVTLLADNLTACRHAGLKIALDDFITGIADVDLIAETTFDYVKIDVSFVQGAYGDTGRRKILNALEVLATQVGAITIAEGIETPEDFELVRELKFDGAQGYLLGMPSPAFEPPLSLEPVGA